MDGAQLDVLIGAVAVPDTVRVIAARAAGLHFYFRLRRARWQLALSLPGSQVGLVICEEQRGVRQRAAQCDQVGHQPWIAERADLLPELKLGLHIILTRGARDAIAKVLADPFQLGKSWLV